VILATKAGRYDQQIGTGFDFSAERILRSVDESLARLRTDYIDLFQVHDIEFGKREQIIDETLPAMHKLQKAGKVRFIGITGYPLHLLRAVATVAEVDTVLSYCRYDLMDTLLDEVLTPFAQAKGIGLINASPLHMRVLTTKGAPEWHPAPRRVLQVGQEAAHICHAKGVDIADLAMQFALAHPYVAVTLVGMSKVQHVERNINLVSQPIDQELLAQVLDVIKPIANICWKSGWPENDDPGAMDKQS
jgi:L-galactose dehydrogenase